MATKYQDEIDSAYDDINEHGTDIIVKNELGSLDKALDTITYPSSTLTTAFSATGASATVASNSDMADCGIIQIGSEKILYEAKSGYELGTLTRGYDGTTAATHANGATVSFLFEASRTVAVQPTFRNNEYVYGDRWKFSNTITITNRLLLIAAKGIDITFDQTTLVDWDNETWMVDAFGTIAPDGYPIMHKAVVKK